MDSRRIGESGMKTASKLKWKAVGVYGKLKGIPDVYTASLLLRSYIADYRKHIYPIYKTLAIHKKGFTAYNWALSELDQNDYQHYLSDLQYYRMHPINGDQSWIIDSKLSLKKICVGTPADQYMPEYYFSITSEGLLQPLSDYHGEKCGKTDWNLIVELLKKKGALAVKRSAGSIGEGFYKCSYESGIFFANEAELENPVEFFSGLRDYLVTEYLMPHPDIAAICPNTANAIRYLVGRHNNSLNYLKGFIRFGTRASGYVENYNVGGVLCYLDRDGYYKEGNVIEKGSYKNRKYTNILTAAQY